MPKMQESHLRSLLAAEKADALAAMIAAKLSGDRARAQDYYVGDMSQDMPAIEGRSSAVSTDVADTIHGLMPSLMDIFCSSDEVVRFEPVGAEDEAAAQQETDYVNHVFMQQNPGFMVMYSFIMDALLSKVGIAKVWWDECEREERETYYDLSDDQYAQILQGVFADDSGLEVIEHTEEEGEQPDPATGQPVPVRKHDLTLKRTKKYAQAKVMGVPPEEFGIERGARDIASCNYCFHEIVTKTQTDLIAEGYDEEQISSIADYTGQTEIETLARDSVQEHVGSFGAVPNPAARLLKITEHYVRLDYEGNGKAQLYQVITGGDQGVILKKDGKLAIEPFDAIPFAAVTPVPVTHRFFGRSIADLVMDIQRIKTALMRGMLDSLYLHTNPRVVVAENGAGINTLDDLLVSRPGGIVRAKTTDAVEWQVSPDISSSIYPALEYLDATREWRTGVTRQGQGIDANALQNQSATAVNQAFTAAQARMKLIARIIAETGVRDMFSLLHATIRKHGQQAQTVRLRNQWVQVDPRNWKTRNDLTINVGLGNGGRAEQAQQAMAIANFQKELLLGGKSNLVDDTKLYNSAANLAKLMGHKNPDLFFNNPADTNPDGSPKYPPPPPPVDPKIMQIQTQAQLDEKSDERKAQIETVQAQADIATQDKKTEAEMIQQERNFQLKRELAMLEFQLEQERFNREEARKDREHAQKMELAQKQHDQLMQSGAFKLVAGAETHAQKMEAAANKEPAQ